MNTKKLLSGLKIVSLAAIFAVGVSYISAQTTFVGPPGNPTTCPTGYSGCDAPLNVGSNAQTKLGSLVVNGSTAATYAQGLQVWGKSVFENDIQIIDGNQSAGKVLTSAANGTGSWQPAALDPSNIAEAEFTKTDGVLYIREIFPNPTTIIAQSGADVDLSTPDGIFSVFEVTGSGAPASVIYGVSPGNDIPGPNLQLEGPACNTTLGWYPMGAELGTLGQYGDELNLWPYTFNGTYGQWNGFANADGVIGSLPYSEPEDITLTCIK